MSYDLIVSFRRSKLPTAAAWSAAAALHGFPLTVDPDADLASLAGWLPCRWREGDSGFEFFLGDSDRDGTDTAATLAGSGADADCVRAAAATLAVLAKGVVEDPQEPATIPASKALAWARGETPAPRAAKPKSSKATHPVLAKLNACLNQDEEYMRVKEFVASGDLVFPFVSKNASTLLYHWLALQDETHEIGLTPVIIAEENPEPLIERLIANAPTARETIAATQRLNARAILDRLATDASRALAAIREEDLPLLRPPFYTESCRLEALANVKKLKLRMLWLPTTDPTEIPAWFGPGTGTARPTAAEQVAVLRRWQRESGGLTMSAIWNDGYAIYFPDSPRNHAAAATRASEYAAFAPATLERSTNSPQHYVQMVRQWSKRVFWWEG
jgi:hypothetical protein